MGLLDDAKKLVDKAVDKASDVLEGNEDKVKGGIDKAADVVDDKTKGKHTDKIENAADKAKATIEKLTRDDGK